MNESLKGKLERVYEVLRALPSALVSYSGGVDSTLLAVLAHETLPGSMAAVIVESPLLPPREMERARRLSGSLGFPLETIELDELSLPEFRKNPPHRCYVCKRHRLESIREKASSGGWGAVLEGSNADDALLHRPGRRALIEFDIISPLEEAGLSKPEIRALARSLGLPNWDTPSRPCLSTRFPYGMELNLSLLERVDAAEECLERIGLRQVRVRLESPDEARIEVGLEEVDVVTGKDNRELLMKKLRGLGFRRILLDLEGYRTGSMDEESAARRLRTLYVAEG